MSRIPNIALSMKQELTQMMCPGEKKKGYIQETKKQRAAAKKELQKQGFSSDEINKLIQEINTYRDKIFSYKTLQIYCKAANAFEDFCEETLRTKRIPLQDCPAYINDFISWGVEKKFSPDTIHTYLAGVCKALRLNIGDYEKPKRNYTKSIRGVNPAQNDDYNASRAEKSLEVNRLLGLRRAELRRLKIADINFIANDYAEIHTKGKGGKKNINILRTTDEISEMKKYVDEAVNQGRIFLLSPDEMKNDADLHHMRALRAQDVYSAVCRDMQEHPERRDFYKNEIQKAFAVNGKKLRENLDTPYRCRGEHRKQLINMEQDTIFDRVAVLYVSC